jgi:hypothetical protein
MQIVAGLGILNARGELQDTRRRGMAMAKQVGRELTEDLYRRLCGEFVEEHDSKVVLVHTVDPSGWPHPAILSYFEVAARDPRSVRLAVYKTSRTTENMRREGKVTLSIFDQRVTFYIKGTALEVRREMRSAAHNSMLDVSVEEVSVDEVDPLLESGAYISGGITYEDPNRAAHVTRHRAILQELLD